MTKLECDAILFDLDGVLIDSTICIERHWREWAGQHGLDLEAIMQAAHGVRTIETMRLVAPHLDVEAEARRFTAGEVADTDGVVVIEGAAGHLTVLAPDRWAVVTSGSRDLASARMRQANLPLPRIFVTADDVTHGKPAPEPYLLAAERLGFDPGKCVVVEDSPAGIKAAEAAGMRVIAIATTHSRQGLGNQRLFIENLEELHITQAEGEGSCLSVCVP